MDHTPQTQLNPDVTTGEGLSIRRVLHRRPASIPIDAVEWELRDARIGHGDKVSFEQRDVEFPKSWSQNATNIVAQKYFRGQLGSPERERSVKQMITRVAGTIAELGARARLLRDPRGRRCLRGRADLHPAPPDGGVQLAGVVQRRLACRGRPEDAGERLLHPLASRTTWSRSSSGTPRRGPSSAAAPAPGINLSKIRGSMETLSRGGTASGPVSFMRGADAWAGSIKSGGGTRRAAKMVVLDVDHPDIREFIWCKAKEEDKAAALRDAGFDMSIDGDGFHSIQYQNANNSVRVTDEFMRPSRTTRTGT